MKHGEFRRSSGSSTVEGLLELMPALLGFFGLVLSVAYQIQRTGAFVDSFYSLDRFIQHHLDIIGGFSSLIALVGVFAGLLILRLRSQRLLVKVGTVVSVFVLLWTIFDLSL